MHRKTASHFLLKLCNAGLIALLMGSVTLYLQPVPLVLAGSVINVTTTNDELNTDGDCSLREAVRAANLDTAVDACTAGSGVDTIFIPAGTYTLSRSGINEDQASTGDLDLTDSVVLNGSGASTTIINANSLDRVFHITNGVVLMSGLTIKGGSTSGNGGGVLLKTGTSLTLTDSTVSGNTATNGGGIYNSGTVTLNSSTVSGNSAVTDGGGLRNDSLLVVNDSTLSGNQAGGSGGGLANLNSSSAVATLSSVTVSNNKADSDGANGGAGGGLQNGALGTINFKNTIVGANTGPSGSPDCSGTLNSQNHNIIQSTSGCSFSGNVANNLTGLNPGLGALQNNGGPTFTQAIQIGSPAIDAGDASGCTDNGGTVLDADQRGEIRSQGLGCDVGAYESPFVATPTPTATATATVTSTPTPTFTPTPPANFVVNSSNDAVDASPGDGQCKTAANECTLRAAIQEANASAGNDVIAIPPGTYGLSLTGTDDTAVLGDLDITSSLTIFGAGATQTFVEDNANDRVFDIVGSSSTVSLLGLTIRNGNVNGDGGGLRNAGNLTLINVSITGNDAPVSGSNGGGISNSGTLTINSSVIYSNHALAGGGISNLGTLSINNSTISGNTVSLGSGGGISNFGVLAIASSTIANNSAADQGGGLWNNGSATLRNSIVAYNSASSGGPDCSGSLSSGGYNIVATTAGCTFISASGDQPNVDPKLQGLADNGGQTQTHKLSADSPAIDAGNPAGCTTVVGGFIATDQRGTSSRHIDGDGNGSAICDMGAYESVEVPTPTPTVTATGTATNSPTASRTPTSTRTITATFTPSNTPGPTNTPLPTSSFTPVPTVTPVKTATLSGGSGGGGGGGSGSVRTPTRTRTPTKTKTPTPTLTVSGTITVSVTANLTTTGTVVKTVTGSATLDGSGGGGAEGTGTGTTTPGTPTNTPSPTPTYTPIPTQPPQLLNAFLVTADGARVNCSRWLLVFPPDLVPVGSGVQCKAVQPSNLPTDHTLISAIKIDVYDPTGKAIPTFSPPFAVCITYTDADVQAANGNTKNLIVMTDGEDGAWTELANTTVDTTKHEVCADVGHLSQVGLYSRVPPPPPSPFANRTTLIIFVGVVIALLAVIVVVVGLIITSRDNKPKDDGGYYDHPYQ